MTIQISKSELLKTVKFGVGKKLLENKKVSIFDSKFELLLENVEPSDRKELINEFFGRKVDYSNPDKMIQDWQSSKAGRKFIEIFNQISPESDFNSNNLFDDKAAWNALRLANDVTDGKYNVEDAKEFQKIFLKNKGGQNSAPATASGEEKKPEEAEKVPTRRRDVKVTPTPPQPLHQLPNEVVQFLKEVQFKHYFQQLVDEMSNKYMKTLSNEQKIDFVQIIEDHFDNIFGTFLTESQFSLEEVRQAIREALNDRNTAKIPLKGRVEKSPLEIGQRPVDPSGFTKSGAHEFQGKFDNIQIDNEKEIDKVKNAVVTRDPDSALPTAEELPPDESLPTAEEIPSETSQLPDAEEYIPTAQELPGDNIPIDVNDALENYLIVPLFEVVNEADTLKGVPQKKPANMVLRAILPGAVVTGGAFNPQLVLPFQAVVNRILKDKVVFLNAKGQLFRAAPGDLVNPASAGQNKKTIRLENISDGFAPQNAARLRQYFNEIKLKGNPKQNQLLKNFTQKYQNTIKRNHEIRNAEAPVTKPNAVIGGNQTKVDHTIDGISPSADTATGTPVQAGPQTKPESSVTPTSEFPGTATAPIPTPPVTDPIDTPTRVLTPAEQKIPLEVIGEMYKPIVNFLFGKAKTLSEAPRKKIIIDWINAAVKQMGEEFKETAAQVKAAAAGKGLGKRKYQTVSQAPSAPSAVQPIAPAPAATSTAPAQPASVNPTAAPVAPPVAKPAAQRGPGGKFAPKNPKAPVQNAGAAPAQAPVAKPVVTTSPSAAAASTQVPPATAPVSKAQSGVVSAATPAPSAPVVQPTATKPEASPANDVEKMRENIRAQVLNADKIKKVLEGDLKAKALLGEMTLQEYEQAYNKAAKAFNGVLAEPNLEEFLSNFVKASPIAEARAKRAPEDKVQQMYGFIINAMKSILTAEHSEKEGLVKQLFAKINAPAIAPTSAPTDGGREQVVANIIKKVNSQEIFNFLIKRKENRHLLDNIEGNSSEEKARNIIYSYYMAKAAINNELHRFTKDGDSSYADFPDAQEAFATLQTLKETVTKLSPTEYLAGKGDGIKTLAKRIVDIFFDFLVAKVGKINESGLSTIKSAINSAIERTPPTIAPPTEIDKHVQALQAEIWPGTVKQEVEPPPAKAAKIPGWGRGTEAWAHPPKSGPTAPVDDPSNKLPAGASSPVATPPVVVAPKNRVRVQKAQKAQKAPAAPALPASNNQGTIERHDQMATKFESELQSLFGAGAVSEPTVTPSTEKPIASPQPNPVVAAPPQQATVTSKAVSTQSGPTASTTTKWPDGLKETSFDISKAAEGSSPTKLEYINNLLKSKNANFIAVEAASIRGWRSPEGAKALILLRDKKTRENFIIVKSKTADLAELMSSGLVIPAAKLQSPPEDYRILKTISPGKVGIKDGAVIQNSEEPAIVSVKGLK
jgi:hypothetical protein